MCVLGCGATNRTSLYSEPNVPPPACIVCCTPGYGPSAQAKYLYRPQKLREGEERKKKEKGTIHLTSGMSIANQGYRSRERRAGRLIPLVPYDSSTDGRKKGRDLPPAEKEAKSRGGAAFCGWLRVSPTAAAAAGGWGVLGKRYRYLTCTASNPFNHQVRAQGHFSPLPSTQPHSSTQSNIIRG